MANKKLNMSEDERVAMANLILTIGELRDFIEIDENNAMGLSTNDFKDIIDDVLAYKTDWLL